MIVNMACPKCGGQSTEYDDKKWSCLRCGNKFVYEPTQASHTLVQSNVHIQGQATFELDVENAKSPLPIMVKMIEHDPSFFGKQIEDKKVEISNRQASNFPIYIQQFFFGGICAFLLVGIVRYSFILALVFTHHKDMERWELGDVYTSITWRSILFVISIVMFFINRKTIKARNIQIQNCQQTIALLEYNNREDIKIGDYIICPHCETPFEYAALNSIPPVESLKHCLNCGRQFFTSGLNSYPVRFK